MSWLVCVLLGVAAASPTPADVRKSADHVLDSSYQSELPHETVDDAKGEASGKQPFDPRRWRPPTGRPHEGHASEPEPRRVGGPLSAIATALLWVLLGVAVVLIGFMLFRELSGYEADAAADEETSEARDGRDDDAVVQAPLGDAEALAGQGRYGEAIHVLLLRTLEELARRVTVRLPRSLTSREILARVAVPDEARIALSDLVGAVEVTHFGSHEPSESDYLACRERFQRFAAAPRGRQ